MSGMIVLGIGNRLGGDDAAGTAVVDKINQRHQRAGAPISTEIMAIDAGTAPESYTSVIRRHRPDLLILVDAADMDLPQGALRTIPPEKISTLAFSTHSMPLSVFLSYVKEFCGNVLLIGVQPAHTEIGEHISRAVRRSVKELAETIFDGRVGDIPPLE
jgi:hydrogenase 3 maturation protease